ncbi:unnamed protein product [Brachionus calyciflorus]|uniref:BPTI/Kunitz inhibitor domain-containing protein n=1 Tax=Brachionus calyciflorus TaxID=104777 RepID=A0A814J621_9BILA|nr:unnamed protein product [Brachionus calyciflorus]
MIFDLIYFVCIINCVMGQESVEENLGESDNLMVQDLGHQTTIISTSTTKQLQINFDKDTIDKILSKQFSNFEVKKRECMQPRKIGGIHSRLKFNYTKKWFYNHKLRKCIQFYYTGKNGNSNNFDECSDCFNRCFMMFSNAIRYKSKNPYNKQGIYLMNLLRTNGNMKQNLLKNESSIEMFASEILTYGKVHQENATDFSRDVLMKNSCIAL